MNIVAELERTCDETLNYFGLEGSELDRRYGRGKWSVRELLHHLSDAETVLFDRIRRVISEPRPVIWAFDQDAWAKRLGYTGRPLELSRDIFGATRRGIIYYATIHYDESGDKEFVHSETGIRTLRQEFDKVVNHNDQHLEHVRLALKAGA